MEEDNLFGVLVLSGSMETSKEEELVCIIKATLLAVDSGETDLSVVKSKHLGSLWRS